MARMPRRLLWLTGIMLTATFLAALLGRKPCEPPPAPARESIASANVTAKTPAGTSAAVLGEHGPAAVPGVHPSIPEPPARDRVAARVPGERAVDAGTEAAGGRLEVLVRERGSAAGLAGATVRLIRHNRVLQESRSAADGRVRLSPHAAGVWVVEALSPDHPPVRRSRSLAPDEGARIELVLERGQSVEVQVHDEGTGSPVSGAEVRLWHAGTGLLRTARTNSTGRTRLKGLPRATWVEAQIHVTCRGFTMVRSPSGSGFERLSADRIRIRMQRTARLAGRVRLHGGLPVTGALVCLDLAATPFRMIAPVAISTHVRGVPVAEGLWALTDDRGQFVLPEFPPVERATIAIRAPGRIPEARHLVLSPGEDRSDFVIRLRSGGGLAGRVVDPKGDPVAGAKVLVARRNRLVAAVRSDASGDFVLDGLAPGRYGVKAGGGSWIESLVKELRLVRGGRVSGLALALRTPAPPLVGRVVDEQGRPRPGVEVVARGVRRTGLFHDETFWPARTETDATGRFRLDRLRPDWAYTVEVDVPGGRNPVTCGPLQPPWGTITITAATPGGIEGVLGAGADAPLTRVTAILEEDRSQQVSEACVTSPFSLAGLVPGRYRVEAHGEDELIAAADGVVVRPGAVTRGVRLVPVVQAAIRGRVVDPSGRPLEGVPVSTLVAQPSGPPRHCRVRTDRDGRFRLTRLRSGVHDLMIGENGLGFAVVRRVAPGAENLVIRFDPSCTLEVAVFDRTSLEPIGGARVGLVTRGLGAARLRTDPRGRVAFKITPGVYAVVVAAEGYRTTGSRVSIQSAGRVVARRFRLVREDP
jgi:protocatechuate 3,4-dioxygenase beta subunit